MNKMNSSSRSYSLYEKIIHKIDSPTSKMGNLRFLAERIMRLAVTWTAWRRKLAFPARTLGSSWWIWRWRFEFVFGLLEYPSIQWCRHTVRRGMVVVDVGAHIGYYTQILSDLVGSSGKVFAFEPSPENFPVLSQNIVSLRHRNVEVYDFAVDDKDATGQLHVSPGHSNHSLVAGYTPEQGVVDVKTITLDTFLAERNVREVNFIKIDVEGNEPHVVAGMKNTVKKSPDLTILIEYNPPALRCGGIEPTDLVRQLQELDLFIEVILPDGSLSTDLFQEGDDTVNFLCKKKSQTRPSTAGQADIPSGSNP